MLLAISLLPLTVAAAPTQEEVFKSIQDNVNDSGKIDLSRVFPYALAGAGFIVLVAFLNQRRGRPPRAKGVNHQGKLLKEVAKALPLKSAEWRQLKALVDDAPSETPLASPLSLLLCPSVMAKSIRSRQARNARIDRKALSSIARKAGVTRDMLAHPSSNHML